MSAYTQFGASEWRDGSILMCPSGNLADHELREIHTHVRAYILSDWFPCLGAKAAVNQNGYRVGKYGFLGNPDNGAVLCDDIYSFFLFQNPEKSIAGEMFKTFIAVFPSTPQGTQRTFHDRLWMQLQVLHDNDRKRSQWAPQVDNDPASPEFHFSLGGVAVFVVGLDPNSPRLSRRLRWPALVFNPRQQFARLRQIGKYDKMRRSIRNRDIGLQGSLNPTIDGPKARLRALTFSSLSEVGPEDCPFSVTRLATKA